MTVRQALAYATPHSEHTRSLPARVSLDPERFAQMARPRKALVQYAEACAETLARAHARGDRRSTRFEAAMAAALRRAGDGLLEAAERYAGRVVSDHGLLRDALRRP